MRLSSVQLLLEKKANPTLADKYRYTPLDIAPVDSQVRVPLLVGLPHDVRRLLWGDWPSLVGAVGGLASSGGPGRASLGIKGADEFLVLSLTPVHEQEAEEQWISKQGKTLSLTHPQP